MSVTVLGLILLPLSPVLGWQPHPAAAACDRRRDLRSGSRPGSGRQLRAAAGDGPRPSLFVMYVVAQYAVGMRYPGEGRVFWALTPLFALLGYALLSIFVLPQAFEGRVMVWPQRPDLIDPGYVPLAFTSAT